MTTGLLPPLPRFGFKSQAQVALSEYLAQEMFIVQPKSNVEFQQSLI